MTEMTKIPQPEIEAYHAGYQAGYEVGKRDAVRHGYWIKPSALVNPCCSECKQYEESGKEKPFCSECGVRMIDEMEYKMLYHSAFPDGKESGE